MKQFQKDHGLVADGVGGAKTYAALDAAEKPADKPKTYTAKIRNLDRKTAEELISKYGGEMIEE